MNPDVIKHLVSMRHSPLHNYIVPGLTSWMIMDRGDLGKIRLFECSRDQQEFITPHSHRFDFSACVIRGKVRNTLWVPVENGGDQYMVTSTKYLGKPGQYESKQEYVQRFTSDTLSHHEGEWYSMKFNEIHSIKFSRGALVLFIENRAMTDTTKVIEPFVDDEYLPTMKTEPWMFRKGYES